MATDTDGNLLTCVVTPANVGERAGMKQVINVLKKDVPDIQKLFLDGGYDGEPFSQWAKTNHELEIEIKRRPDEGITVKNGIAQVNVSTPTEEQIRLA
ncbi:transposase, partial [Deinococcus sp.]|uniref:transposase n=1 Tax=Deinococcus sp. TaxID=47478 RepID=UPI0025BADBBF